MTFLCAHALRGGRQEQNTVHTASGQQQQRQTTGKLGAQDSHLSPVTSSLGPCKGPFAAWGLSSLAGKTAGLKFKPPPGPIL